jgi:hypothetical protein
VDERARHVWHGDFHGLAGEPGVGS